MINKKIFDDLISTYLKQTDIFLGHGINLSDFKTIFKQTCEKYCYCLSKKDPKHFPSRLISHSDEYATFLIFLAKEFYLNSYIEMAESTYLFNRRLNSLDCFYTREMPDIFHLEHPLGSVIGQAKMKNYLTIYQGVTIGGNLKMEYPSIEEGVVLFPKSTVIGSSIIGSNSAIGAGVQIYNKKISENSAVSLRHPEGITINKIKWSIKTRFFPV